MSTDYNLSAAVKWYIADIGVWDLAANKTSDLFYFITDQNCILTFRQNKQQKVYRQTKASSLKVSNMCTDGRDWKSCRWSGQVVWVSNSYI